jgi:catechol 2,3-dioxygenase-like lactoylglutathione lyase family enzyme
MDRAVHRGFRHVAFRVTDLARSRAFYEQLLGMNVVWEPDADNLYLSSGTDNLALHQIAPAELASYQPPKPQLLDHIQAPLTGCIRTLRPRSCRWAARLRKHQHSIGTAAIHFISLIQTETLFKHCMSQPSVDAPHEHGLG